MKSWSNASGWTKKAACVFHARPPWKNATGKWRRRSKSKRIYDTRFAIYEPVAGPQAPRKSYIVNRKWSESFCQFRLAFGKDFLVQRVAVGVHRHHRREILYLKFPDGLRRAEFLVEIHVAHL